MTSCCSVSHVLSLGLVAVVCMVALTGVPGRASVAAPGVEPIVVDGQMKWTSWAITMPDGRLMVWWTEGKDFRDQSSIKDITAVQQALARYSSDNGRTWSEPQLLFEYPTSEGLYGICVALCDRAGVIHLFGLHYFWCDDAKWEGKSRAHHVMSADGGKTWTTPQYCDFGHEYTGSLNSAIQLSSGRIVLPVSYLSPRKQGWYEVVTSLSDDGGKTWRPGQQELFMENVSLCEPVAIELQDGRVLMMFRTGSGYQYEAYSADGGETWTEPQASQFVSPFAPGALLRLRDGRMVFAWNNSLKPSHVLNRLVLAAAISDDDGRTWHSYREIGRVVPTTSHITYPGLTQAPDGGIIATFASSWPGDEWKTTIVRVDPDWLTETNFRDDFSEGLANWVTEWYTFANWRPQATHGTGAATVVAHPDAPERQVLRLRKPKADVAAGASLNFPFGVQGDLTMKLLLQPGFQGARICLTDHFTWPYYAEDGRFGISIAADGRISAGTGEGEFTPTDVTLETRKWYILAFTWDCQKGTCRLTVDGEQVAALAQLSQAVGVCYLRLLSTAEETDPAGLVVDWVSVNVRP